MNDVALETPISKNIIEGETHSPFFNGIHIVINSGKDIVIQHNEVPLQLTQKNFALIDGKNNLALTGDLSSIDIISIEDCFIFKNKHIHLLKKIVRYREAFTLEITPNIYANLLAIFEGYTYYKSCKPSLSISNIIENIISEASTILFDELNISDSLKEDIKWEYLGEFYTLLEDQYNKTRSVTFYSSKIGITAKKLNEICEEIVNKKAKEIVDLRVLAEIEHHLKHSNISMVDIAYELGFYETTNLVKFFKRYKNETPGKYRKKISQV